MIAILGKNITLKLKIWEQQWQHQDYINEETMSRLESGSAHYHSAQNILPPQLSTNIKIQIYKTVILPVLLHGHETWSLT